MPRLRADIQFSLPWAMTEHLPFREQVRAARLSGFGEMSLRPIVIARTLSEGLTLAEMREMLAGEGVAVGRIDPIVTWVPDWRASNFGLDFNLVTAFDPLAIFDLCAHFGAEHVSLNAMWPVGRYGQEEITGHYARLCEKARPYRISCDIEPIPMWGMDRFDQALDMILRSGAENGGLVLDITHFVRAGATLDWLETVPGHLVRTVQVCDGILPKPPRLTLEEECFDREWPGSGTFPIADILAVLDRIGGLVSVGPEVFSSAFVRDSTSPETIATRARESMARYAVLCA
jgi:sugar phosphate isomerase/epimerase